MSIAKMKHLRFEGPLDKLDELSRFIAVSSNIHLVKAIEEVAHADKEGAGKYESYKVAARHEEEKALLSYLAAAAQETTDFDAKGFDLLHDDNVFSQILSRHGIDETRFKVSGFRYDYRSFFSLIQQTTATIKPTILNLRHIEEQIQKRKKLLKELEYFSGCDFDLSLITSLEEFYASVVLISKRSYKKLKENYDNIDIVILHSADYAEDVVLFVFYLKEMKSQFEKVFSSLNYKQLSIPEGYRGTQRQMKKTIEGELKNLEKMRRELSRPIEEFFEKNRDILSLARYILCVEEASDVVKASIAQREGCFVIVGYIPSDEAAAFEKEFQRLFAHSDVSLSLQDVERTQGMQKPPTKVKTSPLFKPFKMMVAMYDTPNYYESDPTAFFALTYMLFFGAMFGDVGQGLVIALLGWVLVWKMHMRDFGGVLLRLGIASTVFGFLYGSVFGSEELLPALLVRPMSNITTVLIGAIAGGALVLGVAYVVGIVNLFKLKQYKEAIFGKTGIAGILFFLSFLGLALSLFLTEMAAYTSVMGVLCVAFLFLIILREPLYNAFCKSGRLFDTSAGDYFLEEGFGSVETILSVLSNSISFIRVGAFALNHAGLYLAFSSLASMASGVGSTLILILGNIVIIGMEGLIVFIQSMRLEYYELFSKYFHGEGIAYDPVRVVVK